MSSKSFDNCLILFPLVWKSTKKKKKREDGQQMSHLKSTSQNDMVYIGYTCATSNNNGMETITRAHKNVFESYSTLKVFQLGAEQSIEIITAI
jgi:hypothetical protein